MNEKLSSPMTFYYKVIFPILWIGIFGLGTLGVWLGEFKEPAQPPPEVKYIFLLGWVVGTIFILRLALRLKSVELIEGQLTIKDYSRISKIPLRNIKEIRESRLINPKTISLTFYPPSDFGKKIIFIPKSRFQMTFNPFSEHPIVSRLRELSGIRKS